jgi:hypothetical protein
VLSASHWSKVRGTVRVRLLVLILLWRACALSLRRCRQHLGQRLDSQHLAALYSFPAEVYPRYEEKLTTASTFHTSSMPESKLYRYFGSAANHVKPHESHLYLQVTLRAKTAMLHSASSCHSSFARPSKLEQPHHAQIAIPRHGSSCTAAVQADSREPLEI